jgi:hypothetical protein
VEARLLARAVAGLVCAFPVGTGAQVSGADAGRPYGAQPFANGSPAYAAGPRYAVPLDQITANVRARGLEPQSRPVLRGAIYYMRAVNRARAEMRVAIDARSGRVLSATRVAYAPPAPPAAVEPAPAPPRRYEPNMSSRGYSEGAQLPPADVPPTNRPAAEPPLPRSGELGEGAGSMPEAPASNPESALNAPNSLSTTPVMAPIAPLE